MYQTNPDGSNVLGPDGHPIPAVQGVVSAEIKPVHIRDMNLGAFSSEKRSSGLAVGHALILPQFETPPTLVPGTEAVRADGTKVENTGNPEPSSVVVTQVTIDQARHAAEQIAAMLHKMPLDPISVDIMNLAMTVLHFTNKGK